MFACHLRTVQGLMADMSLLALNQATKLNQVLQRAVTPSDPIETLRFVGVEVRGEARVTGLIFRTKTDAATLARLVLPHNRKPSPSLHLELPFDGTQPMRLDLHYLGGGKQRLTHVAHYFFSGALSTYPEDAHGYTRIRNKGELEHFDQAAAALRILNMKVDRLPYPKGHKRSIVDAFAKMNIAFVGDLIQRSEDEITSHLGASEAIVVRSLLNGFRLGLGLSIPQWRRPVLGG